MKRLAVRHEKTGRSSERTAHEAADKVNSPENCAQVAAWPRRKARDFRSFPSSRFAAWTAQTPRSGVCHQSELYGSVRFVGRPQFPAGALLQSQYVLDVGVISGWLDLRLAGQKNGGFPCV